MGSSNSMMGKGPKSTAASERVGNMGPGKTAKSTAVKRYFEGGTDSYKGKGPGKARTSSEK